MELRELGRSGIQVSVVGLGCNNFGLFQDADQATACVHAALDEGITFFDMASEHGAGVEEELVGRALRGRRDEVVIATKVGQAELRHITPDGLPEFSLDTLRSGLSQKWIMRSVEESLIRLGTDYIDLYQPHVYDASVPREETISALNDLVQQGKVRAIGEAATAGDVDHLISTCALADAHGWPRFSSMQAKYNLLARGAETELIPELQRRRISLIPYMPLANGLLTGKYGSRAEYPIGSRLEKLKVIRKMVGDADWNTLDSLTRFISDRSLSMTHVAISWLLAKPSVASVIAGASRPEQIRTNVTAASQAMSPADLDELDRLTCHAR
jgi:1-deoxyxylulose-5-phosphate synthase